MTLKETVNAILHYRNYDRMPIVHFGFWFETLEKWYQEGHLTADEAHNWNDGNYIDKQIDKKLGFDMNWYSCYSPVTNLFPAFERKVLETLPDGSKKVLDNNGAIVLEKDHAGSIPCEFDHLLKNRKSWEEHYLPRLQVTEDRITKSMVNTVEKPIPFDQGGLEYLQNENRPSHLGLFCGSLFGEIRNWLGLEGISYLYVDDEPLFDEITQTVADISYNCTKSVLEKGAKFDFAHFWEDICFKNGPLISPAVFERKIGPKYKKITELVNSYGIDIISVDCDGLIDSLIPTWFNNGVNTMFPIEVGTWDANIKPWREKFGKNLRGVGGMKKYVFAQDFAAIDQEIERLKALVDLGGYIPCPDHRIAPDGKWDNVRYYCDKMRQTFGG